MRVEVKSKVIPTSFLKIEGRGNLRWGERSGKEGQLVELVGDQNPSPKAPIRSKREEGAKEMSGEERLPE